MWCCSPLLKELIRAQLTAMKVAVGKLTTGADLTIVAR